MPIGCDSSPLGSKILFSFFFSLSHSYTFTPCVIRSIFVRSTVRNIRTSNAFVRTISHLRSFRFHFYHSMLSSISSSFFFFFFLFDTQTSYPFIQKISAIIALLAIHQPFFAFEISKRHEILGWPIACFRNRRASNGARN